MANTLDVTIRAADIPAVRGHLELLRAIRNAAQAVFDDYMEQRRVILAKLNAMIARKERIGNGAGGWTSIETMQETARRLAEMV